MNVTDDALIAELSNRFALSRKAFAELSVVNRKLLDMNERLERSESLKSNFLSNIRNEINNPLNAIMGLSQQLALISSDNQEVISLADMIGAEAAILDFQLRNIFMAAELEAGEVNPHCTLIHITHLIQEAVDTFTYMAGRKNTQLHYVREGSNEQIVVATDSAHLQIIVSNLLANAIEYSYSGGVVEISCAVSEDGSLQVSVRDYGIGIAPEDQKRIFDRFVQLESGTIRSHPGHGLGLSIAKALVDLMQGKISLESSVGSGSRFTVTLPPCNLADDTSTFAESGNLFIFDDMSEAQER
jgi:signal transduction histidine kinase